MSARLPLTLSADSRDRTHDSSSNSDFTIRIENAISPTCMQIKDVMIPRCFPTIRSGINNAIDFDIGGGELNATIPEGIYDAATFETALETAMDALGGGTTFTASISDTTGFLTITPSAGNLNILWTSGTNTATNLSEIMGWRVSGGVQATDTGALSSLTSPYPVELSPEKYIYVAISPTRRNMQVNNQTREYVLTIPVNVTPYSDIHFMPEDYGVLELGHTTFDRLSFALRYRDGSLVNLRGRSWCVNLFFSDQ